MEERGYVIIANTHEDLVCAAVCSLSLKQHSDYPVALITDLKNRKLFQDFDYVVEMPFKSLDERRSNDWQLYWASPFDRTIAIDCKTIISKNLDSVWDYLEHSYNICFGSLIKDFRGSRVIETENSVFNKIKRSCSDIFYFDKSEASLEYFKLADPIMREWRTAYKTMLAAEDFVDEYCSDLTHSLIASAYRENENIWCRDEDVMSYITMESIQQSLLQRKKIETQWTEYVNTWVNENGKIKIQNHLITGIFNYQSSDFITPEIYENYKLQNVRNTTAEKNLVGEI
jgi:hypothetical protein